MTAAARLALAVLAAGTALLALPDDLGVGPRAWMGIVGLAALGAGVALGAAGSGSGSGLDVETGGRDDGDDGDDD